MTALTNGSNRSADGPAITSFEHAAVRLAGARALEAASHEAPPDGALGPTLACLEQALDAIARAALHLTAHVLDARGEGTMQRLHDMRALLEDSVEACRLGRAAAGPFTPPSRPSTS
jgi:hypothetical protein